MKNTTYQECQPAQGYDKKWYVAGDFSDRFSPDHISFEKDRGNLQEIEMVKEIFTEEEIQNGDLVSFGNRVTIWKLKQ